MRILVDTNAAKVHYFYALRAAEAGSAAESNLRRSSSGIY